MTKYASGRNAFGFCDRCGFRFDLNELIEEIDNGVPNGLRVCEGCLDDDHPQNHLGEIRFDDPQSLQDPRPDLSQDESRRLFSWNPVGQNTVYLVVSVGQVTTS